MEVAPTQHPVSRWVVPEQAGRTKFTDTIDIDQAAHRLYMVDNWTSGVDIFDISTSSARYIKTIRSSAFRPAAFFGLCVAASVGRIFVAHGTSLVSAIDVEPTSATADTVISTVSTGGSKMADLIDYAPTFKKVYVANRDEHFMTSIDATTGEIANKIVGLGAALEQPRFNSRDGMVYLVSNADNVIHQIDASTDRLVATFEIGSDCNPNGLAINPSTNQALLACDFRARPRTIIWDITQRRIASVIEGCGCGDGAIYDPTVDRFFFAASGYPSGPVIGIFGGQPVVHQVNVPTQFGASWVAFDQTNKMVYAPAVQDGRPALIGFRLEGSGPTYD